jgi:FkbM family methyltransferase
MNIQKLAKHIPPRLRRVIKPIYRKLRGPTKGDRYDVLTYEIIGKILAPNSNAIDIGCHSGEILDVMLKCAPFGNLYAFEPLPDFAAHLRRRFQSHTNVRVFECALSDTVGQVSFHHNITSPDYSGIKRRTYDRGDTKIEKIEVELATLDSLVPDGEVCDLIKLDVEGAEYQVLRGATRVIGQGGPVIVFEHGIGGADHYGTRPEMIFDLLSELQYDIYPLDPSFNRALSRDDMIKQFEEGTNHYFCAVKAGSARPF